MQLLEHDVPEEPQLIPLTDAGSDPRTVMVVGRDAHVALLAMLAPKWLLNVADCAVLIDNKLDAIGILPFVVVLLLSWLLWGVV